MNSALLTFFAFAPIIFLLAAFYLLNWPGLQAMWMTVFIAACISAIVWRTPVLQVSAGIVQGLFNGGHFIFMLFCSTWMLQVFVHSETIQSIRKTFLALHPDPRVYAIIVPWFFGPAAESLLCFSPPIMACTLMLGGMGFPAACAVMVAVMGTVLATSFGAMGHSIICGVDMGISEPLILGKLATQGITIDMLNRAISAKVALIQGVAGMFLPVMIIMMMTRFFGKNKSWTEGLSMAPFAFFCAFVFIVPYMLIAILIGPEFPSLLASLISMPIIFFTIRRGFLMPHDRWEFPPMDTWPANWTGVTKFTPPAPSSTDAKVGWRAFLIVVAVILITRIPMLPFYNWLHSFPINISNVFGTNVNLYAHTAYYPSVILLVMGWIYCWWFKIPTPSIRDAFGGWALGLAWIGAGNAIFVTIAAVYMNSSVNAAGIPGMIHYLVQWLDAVPGGEYLCPYLSVLFAALGSFGAANNVTSSLIFSSMQCYGADLFGFSMSTMLALQVAGASAGCMISEHYLAGPGAIIGYLGWETPSTRRVLRALVVYLLILGTIGVLLTQFPGIITYFLGDYPC